jgi:hypothetical protein
MADWLRIDELPRDWAESDKIYLFWNLCDGAHVVDTRCDGARADAMQWLLDQFPSPIEWFMELDAPPGARPEKG